MAKQEGYTRPLQPVSKPSVVQKISAIDIGDLLRVLNKLPEHYWQQSNSNKTNNYPVFHSTDHIVMRFVEPNDDPRDFRSEFSWKLMAQSALPIMNSVAEAMKISDPVYPKAMFARLKAGAIIDQHVDHGSSHALVHKIHVPLVTHADVVFSIGDEKVHLEKGFAYEVNNLDPHGVENPAVVDRIHFIFEVFDNTK